MKDTFKQNSTTSRRRFAQTVAATLLAAPFVPAQTPNPTPNAVSPLVAAYLDVARARWGAQIPAEQWEQVRRELEGNARTAERLRGFALKNGDEPAFAFRA